MPLCTFHLLSLTPATTIPTFLATLHSTPLTPLTIARVIRWIILPTQTSRTPLLAHNTHWDLLLILPTTGPLPPTLQPLIQHHWTVTAGVPSQLLTSFGARNQELLHPAAAT
ncbi:hypothetical protein AOQ84DRAFT_224361, partial [Glonium stellatum]